MFWPSLGFMRSRYVNLSYNCCRNAALLVIDTVITTRSLTLLLLLLLFGRVIQLRTRGGSRHCDELLPRAAQHDRRARLGQRTCDCISNASVCLLCHRVWVLTGVCCQTQIGKLQEFQVFSLCFACLMPCILCQFALLKLTVENPDIGTTSASAWSKPKPARAGMRTRASAAAATASTAKRVD